MKILLDENFPQGFKKKLSIMGHDVKHINEIKKGLSDKEVIELAIREKRLLMSNDIDFKDYLKLKHYGIIKFYNKESNIQILFDILKKYSKKKLEDIYIEFNKKDTYIGTKVYTKKGKYKQISKKPLIL